MSTLEPDSAIYCADCHAQGREQLMIKDRDAGHLCPVCDVHDDCSDFPCSADPELNPRDRCPLNEGAAA